MSGAGRRENKSVDALKSAFPLKCEVCLEPMKPGTRGSPRRFCCARCRRLAWGFRLLAEALEAGQADGLRARIREVGRP